MSNETTPKPPKKKQIDFIVTTSNPSDVSGNQANKKRVRSVAALKSWPERRKKIFEQLGNSGGGQGAFLVDEQHQQPPKRKSPTTGSSKGLQQQQSVPARQHAAQPKRTRVFGPPRPPRTSPPSAGPCSRTTGDLNPQAPVFIPSTNFSAGDLSYQIDANATYRRRLSETPGSSMQLYRKAFRLMQSPPSDEHHITSPDTICRCRKCQPREEEIVSTSTAPIPPRSKRMADGSEKQMFNVDMSLLTPPQSPGFSPSRGRADPFNCYPVQYQPWFDLILNHMMTVYAPRGWPALKITESQGVKWEWFMTQISLSEPALFYVRLLFGSGDMIRLGSMRKDIMYWLRAEAIKSINTALADPEKSCCDALILAVGRIALHEHMYGDKYASSHVHRPAQKRMIEIRGGMKALEFPKLVKKLMRWSDKIMAVGSGTPRLLEDDETNPNFTLKQSVGAIAGWAPQEMPGVRSKIKISDLVNDEDEA